MMKFSKNTQKWLKLLVKNNIRMLNNENKKVQVTGAKVSTVDYGYFSNALYDTYLQLTTT